MNGTVLVALIGAMAGIVSGTVAALLNRPKTRGEAAQAQAAATQSTAAGEVAYSADAREWARQFAERAAAAERKAAELEERVNALEDKLDAEQKARQRVGRQLRAEQTWSLFLEDFLREHKLPIPPRPRIQDISLRDED